MVKTSVFNGYISILLKALRRLSTDASDERSADAAELLAEIEGVLRSGEGYDSAQFRSWTRRQHGLGVRIA